MMRSSLGMTPHPKLGADYWRRYYGLDGTLRDSLIEIWDQTNPASGTSDATWSGLLGNHDLVQNTVGNQAAVTTGPPDYRDYDGSDYSPLEEIDDETGMTLMPDAALCDLTDANGTCVLPTGTAYEGSTTASYRVVLKAAGTLVAAGYAGPVDSEVAYGSELITSGGMEAGAGNPVIPTNWSNDGQDVGEASAIDAVDFHGGAAAYDLNVDAAGEGIVSTAFTTTTGTAYRFSVWLKRFSGSLNIRVLRGDSGGYTVSKVISSGYATWTEYTVNFVETNGGAGAKIYFLSTGGAARWKIDDISNKAYTAFGGDAVEIYKEPSLTTRGWTSTGAGAVNSIDSLEIYKVLGTDNLTGDQWYYFVFKPDDGQPGSHDTLLALDEGIAGSRQLFIWHRTDGKLALYITHNGTDLKQIITDNVMFSNGAQSDYSCVGFNLDVTNGTGNINLNGSDLAISETISASAVFDSSHPLTIGSRSDGANYANSTIALVMIGQGTATATQMSNIYNALKSRMGL